MAIFVDSADPRVVAEAAGLGLVAGVTTNPSLIAHTERRAEEVIAAICAVAPGVVFHQLTAEGTEALSAEAERFLGIAPGRVALKIPCRRDGLSVVRAFADRAVCAITAVYTPAQAYLGSEAGARYVIPYVNRASRHGLDSVALVRGLAEIVAISGKGCEVLAASVKTAEEAVAMLVAGARHLTLPWPVLASMVDHPLTSKALAEFAEAAGRGSNRR